jgi:phosphopantetheine--protein transferase-like protein
MAWARTQTVTIRAEALTSGLCTVRQVLGAGGDDFAVATASALPVVSARGASDLSAPGGEIGIDLEEVDSLPEASDYREHSFFRDYFSSAEIAYCIRQPNTRASFCGLWAAKEAILKAGLIPATSRLMKEFEIGHDEQGRPTFPACRLSISHTSRFAVAVCVAAAATPAPVRTERAPVPEQILLPPGKKKWPWSAPQAN